VLLVWPIGEPDALVFGALAPLDKALCRRAEVARLVAPLGLVKDEEVVTGQTDVHVRVDTLPPWGVPRKWQRSPLLPFVPAKPGERVDFDHP
jgi:hypothetical protein